MEKNREGRDSYADIQQNTFQLLYLTMEIPKSKSHENSIE
jgi:hypothetical protein